MTPQRMFYALLGLTLALMGGGVAIYYYFNNSLTELNHDVGELLADQEIVGKQITAYQRTERQVEELSFVQDLANDVLPDSKEQARVVAEIKSLVTQAGLQLETLSFSSGNNTNTGLSTSQTEAVKNLAGVRVLPATAIISQGARYEDIIKLLELIESNQRKMQVTEISLAPIPDGNANLLNVATIRLNIYLRAAVVVPVGEQSPGATP